MCVCAHACECTHAKYLQTEPLEKRQALVQQGSRPNRPMYPASHSSLSSLSPLPHDVFSGVSAKWQEN